MSPAKVYQADQRLDNRIFKERLRGLTVHVQPGGQKTWGRPYSWSRNASLEDTGKVEPCTFLMVMR